MTPSPDSECEASTAPARGSFKLPHAGWLLFLGCLVFVVLGAAAWYYPHLRRAQLAQEIRASGGTAHLSLANNWHWIRECWPKNSALPPPGNLRWVQFDPSTLPDELFTRVCREDSLVAMELHNPHINPSALLLLKNCRQLKFLWIRGATPAHNERLANSLSELERDLPRLAIILSNEVKLGILGEPDPRGLRLTEVMNGSAAARIGLVSGDILTTVAGQPVASLREVCQHICRCQPGETLTLQYIRGTESRSQQVEFNTTDLASLRGGF